MTADGNAEFLRERDSMERWKTGHPYSYEETPNARLAEDPNPDATVPTGMCGSSKRCDTCPSTFLCFMKASAERDIIKGRSDHE